MKTTYVMDQSLYLTRNRFRLQRDRHLNDKFKSLIWAFVFVYVWLQGTHNTERIQVWNGNICEWKYKCRKRY